MATLEEAFDAIFDACKVATKQVAVKKEDLTEDQREGFIFVFGQEAFDQANIFLVEVN